MSQIYKNSISSGPIPPTVPTSFVTDNGTAVPALNILDVFGGTSTLNNPNGVQTIGSTNVVTVQLTNRAIGTVTTNDATPTTLISFALGAVPGTYTFDISVAGFATAGAGAPAGCGYAIVGSVRTDGAVATLLPNQAIDHFEEAALTSPDTDSAIVVSGNNAIVQVIGKDAYTINWNGTLHYIFQS